MWHLMVDCRADTSNRNVIGKDGVTLYTGIKGREANICVAEFGEKLMYHITRKVASDTSKVESR